MMGSTTQTVHVRITVVTTPWDDALGDGDVVLRSKNDAIETAVEYVRGLLGSAISPATASSVVCGCKTEIG